MPAGRGDAQHRQVQASSSPPHAWDLWCSRTRHDIIRMHAITYSLQAGMRSGTAAPR